MGKLRFFAGVVIDLIKAAFVGVATSAVAAALIDAARFGG